VLVITNISCFSRSSKIAATFCFYWILQGWHGPCNKEWQARRKRRTDNQATLRRNAMKTRILAAALIAALSQATFADSGAYWNNVDTSFDKMLETKKAMPLPSGDYWAGIESSFDNMLSHQPYAGPTEVTVARGQTDPVAAMLHAMVRDTNQPATARAIDLYRDNVGAAFGRMLDHTAYAGETGVTAPRQLDHRVDRLVLALQNPRATTINLAAVQE
jgi:hypothetical protein